MLRRPNMMGLGVLHSRNCGVKKRRGEGATCVGVLTLGILGGYQNEELDHDKRPNTRRPRSRGIWRRITTKENSRSGRAKM